MFETVLECFQHGCPSSIASAFQEVGLASKHDALMVTSATQPVHGRISSVSISCLIDSVDVCFRLHAKHAALCTDLWSPNLSTKRAGLHGCHCPVASLHRKMLPRQFGFMQQSAFHADQKSEKRFSRWNFWGFKHVNTASIDLLDSDCPFTTRTAVQLSLSSVPSIQALTELDRFMRAVNSYMPTYIKYTQFITM